jgi:hypothetical protein
LNETTDNLVVVHEEPVYGCHGIDEASRGNAVSLGLHRLSMLQRCRDGAPQGL